MKPLKESAQRLLSRQKFLIRRHEATNLFALFVVLVFQWPFLSTFLSVAIKHDNYFSILHVLVAAPVTLYGFYAVFANSEHPKPEKPGFLFDIFYEKSGILHRWARFVGWSSLLYFVFYLRQQFFVSEVSGAFSSPCGRSSCSRDSSFSSSETYNPNGYFHAGEKFDESEKYVFCNYKESCRWSSASGEPIQGYFPLSNNLPDYSRPKPKLENGAYEQGGKIGTRPEDYPDLGTGIAGGRKIAGDVDEPVLCPGNDFVGHTAGTFAPLSVAYNAYKIRTFRRTNVAGLGRQICSVCSAAEDFDADTDTDPFDNHCSPPDGGGINVMCYFCPGPVGLFGGAQPESTHPDDLRECRDWSLIVFIVSLLQLLVYYGYIKYSSGGKKEDDKV